MSETTFTKRAAPAAPTIPERCLVAGPTVVYVWPKTKDQFDKLAVPEKVYGWKPGSFWNKDDQFWENRTLSKTVIGSESEVCVIFLWCEHRVSVTTAVPGGPAQ